MNTLIPAAVTKIEITAKIGTTTSKIEFKGTKLSHSKSEVGNIKKVIKE